MKSTGESELKLRYESVGEMSRAGLEPTSTKKASQILWKSPRTIRRWIDEGKLIACKEGRFWFVHPQLIKSCPPTVRHEPP